MRRLGAVGFLMLWLAASAGADNWPNWRGPGNQGHSAEVNLPLTWSAKEKVKWKVALPDEGNSTPIVWGDRIFLTQATEKKDWPPKPPSGGPASAHQRSLWCLDRATGKVLWQQAVHYPELEPTHSTNPFCSASPATDGASVVVSHGSAGMYCYDFNGKELWKKELGKLEHIWGNASSPIFYGDFVVLFVGPGPRQALLAVHKKTGATAWETPIPGGKYGTKGEGWVGSWCTPLIVSVNGRDEMLVSVSEKLQAFDPKTGKELWSCEGLGKLVYTSPVAGNGVAVAMAGYGGAALGVRLGGTGDVTKTHRLWHHAKANPQRIGSPVVVGGHLYVLNEQGQPACYELKTGKEVWEVKERPAGGAWGSMVHAAGRLYVTTSNGDTLVFAASPKYELLARNRLAGETVRASIVPSQGELLIRTYKHLWCIAETK